MTASLQSVLPTTTGKRDTGLQSVHRDGRGPTCLVLSAVLLVMTIAGVAIGMTGFNANIYKRGPVIANVETSWTPNANSKVFSSGILIAFNGEQKEGLQYKVDKYRLCHYPDNTVHIFECYFVNDKPSPPMTLFEGTIMNKSELIILMKQLGIN